MKENQEYFSESIETVTKSPEEMKIEKEWQRQVFAATKMFETDIIESKNKQIKTYRLLSLFLGVSVIAVAVAIAGLTPLKTVEPFVLRVDNTTGFVDKVEPYNVNRNTVNEAVIRYFLARYIENREGYEWFTVQNMYDYVESTSGKSVFDAYKNYMMSEYSPVKKLAKSLKMQVKVNGITFLDNDTAQIRFTKMIADPDGKQATGYQVTKWLATVKFDFSKKITTEQQRLLNPLGMSVISYRVDAEVIK